MLITSAPTIKIAKLCVLFVINEFCKYSAYDANCSAGYAQSVIANHFSTKFLEKLNNVLIDEAIEFGAEQVEAA